VPLWIDHKRGNKWFYKINREHPLVLNIKEKAKEKPEAAIELLLRFIEETIPVKSIYIKEAEEPDTQGKPFEFGSHEDIRFLMKSLFETLITQGKTKEEAKSIIINLDPFNHYPEYFEILTDHD
jgi:hypothetical protein